MKELKKFFNGSAAKVGAGFLAGWMIGRGVVTGFQDGEGIIGGIIVSLILTIILHMFLPKEESKK